MSTRKQHLVAFIALLSPALLFATSINVTFDAALTNATDWTYIGNIKPNKDGDYYINGQGARITSPCYNFAITSIVLRISTSGSCTRNLIISSYDNETSSLPHEFTDIPQGTSSDITATWNISDHVRSLAITSTIGAQSLYFYSAVISGVPIIDAPTNLQADNIRGTRCGLSWTNPANAVSNRVDVLEVTRIAGSSSVERKYDFNEFSNDGTTSQQTESIVSAYPDLSGYMLCLPTNTTGQIQLSTRDDKGVLVIREFESYEGLCLELVARHYDHTKEEKTMSIGYVLDGATNEFASVELSSEFSPSSIPLSEVPAGAQLILNNSGNKQYHRVIIDEISFVRNFAVSTNLVKTVFATGNATTIRGLSPYSSYIASITAFDADGDESEPSEPISFMTNGSELPLVIRLQ